MMAAAGVLPFVRKITLIPSAQYPVGLPRGWRDEFFTILILYPTLCSLAISFSAAASSSACFFFPFAAKASSSASGS